MTTLNVAFVRDEWLPALRSGEYQQGKGRLRRFDDTFCCLGVAADLLVRAGVLPAWKVTKGESSYQCAGMTGALGESAYRRTGISNDLQSALIDLNDSEGKSFPEIADFIEREWLAEEESA